MKESLRVQGLNSGAKVANSKEGGVSVPELSCSLFLSDLEGILLLTSFSALLKLRQSHSFLVGKNIARINKRKPLGF